MLVREEFTRRSAPGITESVGVEPSLPRFVETFGVDQFESRNSGATAIEPINIDAWTVRAKTVANRAVKSANDRPCPVTYIRAAQALLIAGTATQAAEMARKTLEYVRQQWLNQQRFDLASSLGAVRVLRNTEQSGLVYSLLTALPRHPLLDVARAMHLIDQGDLDGAFVLLQHNESSEAPGLRGYILLRQQRYQDALRELRLAKKYLPGDPDVAINTAVAYWELGAFRRAVNSAREASLIAPGRKDIALKFLKYLIRAGRIQEAQSEVRSIRDRSVAETTDFLIVQAQIAAKAGQNQKAVALLRRTTACARREGDICLESETNANVAVLRAANGEIDRDFVLAEIRKSLSFCPQSVALVSMLADWSRFVSDGVEVRRYYSQLSASPHDMYWPSLNMQLAYLECRWEDVLTWSIEWQKQQPLNSNLRAVSMMLTGQVLDNWNDAATMAREALRCVDASPRMRNDCAYVLALAGNAKEARSVLGEVDKTSYLMTATLGLVEMALGRIAQGMAYYRQAAELADKEPDGEVVRALMTCHQTLALRRLNLLDRDTLFEIRAGALPPVDLPDDWANRPDFKLLESVAARHGWPWPSVIS